MGLDYHGSYRGTQRSQYFKRYVDTSPLNIVCEYRAGGICLAYVHRRSWFAADTSAGQSKRRCVLAWSTVFIEPIVEPKSANIPR